MDPLAQLSDIHLPEQVTNYPIALGWWLVYLFALVLLLSLAYQIRKYRLQRRAQKHALLHITNSESPEEMLRSLKWVILAYFPRKNVASLSGQLLLNFLAETLPIKHREYFTTQAADLFTAIYQKPLNETENEQLKTIVLFWIKHALPPKQTKNHPVGATL